MFKSISIIILIASSLFAYNEPIVVRIGKAEFMSGIVTQNFLKKYRSYIKQERNGVSRKKCVFFQNIYNNNIYINYVYQGFIQGELSYYAVEKITYSGHSYILGNKTSCRVYEINGYPFVRKGILACFNEKQSTDRIDSIEVWLIKNNKLTFIRRINLNSQQLHLDGRWNVRFSKDNKFLYFKSIYNTFFKISLQ